MTLKDKPSTVQAVEWMLNSQPDAVRKAIRREVGHSPVWSQPEWTAQMLIGEAEEVLSL